MSDSDVEIIDTPPNPGGIATSLQSLGYKIETAIADLIDNSIDAEATHVNVVLELDIHNQVVVRIEDNGTGMNRDGLISAMRYANGNKSSEKLGRFGLGLKTASTSMSNLLTVISATDTGGKVFACWDVDKIRATDSWGLQIGPADVKQRAIFDDAMSTLQALGADSGAVTGTVVEWGRTFGIIKGRGGNAPLNPANSLVTLIRRVSKHLSLTFQRFLDPNDSRAATIVIAVNGEAIVHWDPFCEIWATPEDRDGKKEFSFQKEDGTRESVVVRTFILPDPNSIEDPEFGNYADIGLGRQGIYLYRNARLIEGPDWFGIGVRETHLNRLRVEISFKGILDELFALDVTKSDAMLDIDPGLQDELSKYLMPLRREADIRTRKARAENASENSTPIEARTTEITIGRNLKSLDIPSSRTAPDGSLVLQGNQGDTTIIDSSGEPTGQILVLPEDESPAAFVQRQPDLRNGSLWEAAWQSGKGLSVMLNTGHAWYQKAYLPYSDDVALSQAIEYLFFALAQAEYNNSDENDREAFETFRIDVSRNLQKLVKHLPDNDG